MAGVTSNYSNDSIYRLTQVLQGTTTTESYSYDAVGNRTASLGVASYTTNTSNEMTANSNASYTYDANGNTLTKVVSSNTTSYAWDYENRLASVTLPSSGGTVTFKYDPFGRRVEKISPSATSIFLYDGDNLIEEANSTGAVVARYSQGQSIDEPVAVQRATTTDYYEEDGLGSITSLTATNGAVAQSYTYDSFGNLTNSSGSLTNFFRYTGREFDSETSLYYYRARFYDPSAGRFLSEDPLSPELMFDNLEVYEYVENDPVDFEDPLGLYKIAKPKPGHPVTPPPSPGLDNLLTCMEGCISRASGGQGLPLVVSSTTEGKHQDPGHAAGTSVDIFPPAGIPASEVFCCAGQCGAKWGINEDTSRGGQTTPDTSGANYHLQLFPPHHPSPKAPNAIPPGCVPGAVCPNKK